MWLVSQKKLLINMDFYEKVYIEENKLVFESPLEVNQEIDFENLEESQQAFSYILQALKRKDEVVNL